MKQFRLLKADEIECRISVIKSTGLSLLLYKTARTDAALLDETVGTENWENDFKVIDGVLFGGIGIRYGDKWIWKWDAGAESNTEAEKGRASDAFKRAGFKHGIGRELYSAPFIWVNASDCNIVNGNKCYDKFAVSEIAYDEQERINRLTITCKGKTVYELGNSPTYMPDEPKREAKAAPKPTPKQETPKPEVSASRDEIMFKCADCGAYLEPYVIQGKTYSIREWAEGTKKEFGRPVCRACRQRLIRK